MDYHENILCNTIMQIKDDKVLEDTEYNTNIHKQFNDRVFSLR